MAERTYNWIPHTERRKEKPISFEIRIANRKDAHQFFELVNRNRDEENREEIFAQHLFESFVVSVKNAFDPVTGQAVTSPLEYQEVGDGWILTQVDTELRSPTYGLDQNIPLTESEKKT